MEHDFERVGIDKEDFFALETRSTVVPVAHKQYLTNMGMEEKALVQQVQRDVPRSTVRVNGVHITDPDLLIRMICASVSPAHATTVLSMVTQTCLAQPVEAVATCLGPFQFVGERFGAARKGITIDIRVEGKDKVTVHVEKPMAIVEIRDHAMPQTRQHIVLRVEYDSTIEGYILVHLAMRALVNLNK